VTKQTPRILTLDIETAPLSVHCWGIWEQDVGLDMIKDEWSILSFSARWLGDKRVIFKCTGGRGADLVRDDKPLCGWLWELLDMADIVVTQNGKAFDMKKINARMLMHGVGPYSPVRVVDTKLIARRHFAFTSNRLAWMSKHVNRDARKSEHKRFPGFELWSECLRDNPAAWREMRAYNALDVIATEELYLRLRPWMDNHPNVAVYGDSTELACPKCGGHNLQRRGTAVSQTGRYQRFQCVDCGGWAKSRKGLDGAAKRAALLAQ
jgi:predicted RNA-binding Zn-ribbon protein involved in translation (DUF1610 family)